MLSKKTKKFILLKLIKKELLIKFNRIVEFEYTFLSQFTFKIEFTCDIIIFMSQI